MPPPSQNDNNVAPIIPRYFEIWIVFSIVYLIYNFTSFASIPGGDAGELAAEACQFGIAHPPGYPLYTMLYGWLSEWSMLRIYYDNGSIKFDPLPTRAWKMNQISCIIGGWTSMLIASSSTELIYHWNKGKEISNNNKKITPWIMATYIPSFLYAFSPLIWEYSIGSEVFTMNNFLCSLILYLSIKIIFEVRNKRKIFTYIVIGGFVSGLCACNQHSSALLLAIAIKSRIFKF